MMVNNMKSKEEL